MIGGDMVIKQKWYGDKVIKNAEQAAAMALEATALLIEGQAKALCPVDTGNLRNSITYEIEGNKARIGTNISYSKFVELGTSKMAAQPFLSPAVEMNKDKFRVLLKNAQKQVPR